MPLSDHEQRQLEQIEQALYREDPKFGRLVRSSDPRVHYKRKLAQALIGVVIGAGLLAAGIVTRKDYLEAAGAVVLLLALIWTTVSWRRHLARVRPPQSKARQARSAGSGRLGCLGPARRLARPADGADGRALAPPTGAQRKDLILAS